MRQVPEVQPPEPTSSCPFRIDTKNIEEMARPSIDSGASPMPASPFFSPGRIRPAEAADKRMKTAVIIGAGPAGLTAALELQRRSGVHPIVLEATQRIGGISCTIRHNGNRMDIGGHRFFSKADRVMNWWTDLLPIASGEDGSEEHTIRYQNRDRLVSAGTGTDAATDPDLVMLVRPRKSRIYFLRSFFDYPLALNGRRFASSALAHYENRLRLPAREIVPAPQ